MDINGVSSAYAYSAKVDKGTYEKKNSEVKPEKETQTSQAAVYEKSEQVNADSSKQIYKMSKTDREAIVKQMKDFVATFVECGGREVDGVDYYIARKILRKFEQLNLAFIKNELDEFINYLNVNFGKENMSKCKDFILRLKKSM